MAYFLGFEPTSVDYRQGSIASVSCLIDLRFNGYIAAIAKCKILSRSFRFPTLHANPLYPTVMHNKWVKVLSNLDILSANW